MAVLLLYVAVQLTGPGAPFQNQAVVMNTPAPTAQDQAPVKRESAAKMAAVPQITPASLVEVAAAPALPMGRWKSLSRWLWRKGRPCRRRKWIFPAGTWMRNWRE